MSLPAHRSVVGRIVREPLVHFLAIGAAVCILSRVAGAPARRDIGTVTVTAAEVRQMVDHWRRTWDRPPAPDELDALIEARVREDILCREAIALGLDRNDSIVRERLVRKMEYLAAGFGEAIEPTDEQLAAYLEANSDAFGGSGLDEVGDRVRREWGIAERRKAEDEMYRRLRQKYRVIIEASPEAGVREPE